MSPSDGDRIRSQAVGDPRLSLVVATDHVAFDLSRQLVIEWWQGGVLRRWLPVANYDDWMSGEQPVDLYVRQVSLPGPTSIDSVGYSTIYSLAPSFSSPVELFGHALPVGRHPLAVDADGTIIGLSLVGSPEDSRYWLRIVDGQVVQVGRGLVDCAGVCQLYYRDLMAVLYGRLSFADISSRVKVDGPALIVPVLSGSLLAVEGAKRRAHVVNVLVQYADIRLNASGHGAALGHE